MTVIQMIVIQMTVIQMIGIQMKALAGFEPAISGLVVEWFTTVLPLLGTCCKTIRYNILSFN